MLRRDRHLLLVLLLAMPVADAASVHKCLGADGAVSYQSDPCPAGARVSRTWDGQALREPDAKELARRKVTQARDSAYLRKLVRRKAHPAQWHMVRTRSPTCERIRARRDALDRQGGNAMGFEARRRWNDRIHEACR